MFDFTGHPLASLNVFKYLKYGATAPLAVDYIPDVYVSCNVGEDLVLPESIDVVYNDRSQNKKQSVSWNETQMKQSIPRKPAVMRSKGHWKREPLLPRMWKWKW